MTDKIAVNCQAKLADISELLSYCPETGLLRWKVARGRCAAGSVAGYDTGRGYIGVRVNKRCTYAHRVATLHPRHETVMTGPAIVDFLCFALCSIFMLIA